MALSVFDMFKIGIGPSSSHTVGPMKAANRYTQRLRDKGLTESLEGITVELFGSLALTGKGHGTDKALILGLVGHAPDTIAPDEIGPGVEKVQNEQVIPVTRPDGSQFTIPFSEKKDIKFHRRKSLPYHPNGLRFTARGSDGESLDERIYYSIGGGFVVDEETAANDNLKEDKVPLPYPFATAKDLVGYCEAEDLTFSDIMMANETCWRSEDDIIAGLDQIWDAMEDCIERGCRTGGTLPGKLNVRRRAPDIRKSLTEKPKSISRDPLITLDWVNLYALAVNEENACGSRVVTAPTNGAAGILPAVLKYYDRFSDQPSQRGVREFLLTAAAIGILYAINSSISGAEVGCQGEVGVACSMAAGGLTAAMGGTVKQVEEAAEVGMEHNLGLTCDPIGGLVQIPCIERNAMGAVKAINASRIALRGNGQHFVSLDSVIKTMKQTGADMKKSYKETSRGGLAVNVTEC